VKSEITSDFLEGYRKLPREIREQARKAYRLFRDNPNHRSLNFKRIHSNLPVFSARVNRGYRTLGIREGDTIIWFWIGSHDDYIKMINRL